MVSNPPPTLIKDLKESRCVLFAGSGLSKWADLPTWAELLNCMVNEVEQVDPEAFNRTELDDLIAKGKLLEVADYCKDTLSPNQYYDILSNQLNSDNGEIPEPHKIIVNMPFSAVVTTNFDTLLELAWSKENNGLLKARTHKDTDVLGTLLFSNKFFLLKAHGDIDRPDTLVFTAQDYQEIIHSNLAFKAVFSAILLTKSILFIGYSLSDPDFRLLLDWQFATFKGNHPERYALMSGVGKIERDVLWRTANIRVIPYDDHAEVLPFLQQLSKDYITNVVSPAS
jgi:hypothetical protein